MKYIFTEMPSLFSSRRHVTPLLLFKRTSMLCFPVLWPSGDVTCLLFPSSNTGLTLDLIQSISDPEHPSMTLEQLAVVSAPQITILNEKNHCLVEFTPTVPHCGMSTLIGLCLILLLVKCSSRSDFCCCRLYLYRRSRNSDLLIRAL